MAFTRKMLKALGLNEDQVESVMDEHVSVIEGLKAYKADAEQLPALRDQLKKAEDEIKSIKEKGGDAAKVQAEFDAYKKQVEADKKAAASEHAIRDVIKEAGIARESYINLVYRGLKHDDYDTDDSGKLTKASADKLKQLLAGDDYKDFRGTVSRKGTEPTTPPAGGSGSDTPKSLIEALNEHYSKE